MLPNGEPRQFSPEASTLIMGSEDAVLTDPPMTIEQARVLGDWVAAKGRNVTDIFVTHGHGDHWFGAGVLVERFGARVVASAGTIVPSCSGRTVHRSSQWSGRMAGCCGESGAIRSAARSSSSTTATDRDRASAATMSTCRRR